MAALSSFYVQVLNSGFKCLPHFSVAVILSFKRITSCHHIKETSNFLISASLLITLHLLQMGFLVNSAYVSISLAE